MGDASHWCPFDCMLRSCVNARRARAALLKVHLYRAVQHARQARRGLRLQPGRARRAAGHAARLRHERGRHAAPGAGRCQAIARLQRRHERAAESVAAACVRARRTRAGECSASRVRLLRTVGAEEPRRGKEPPPRPACGAVGAKKRRRPHQH